MRRLIAKAVIGVGVVAALSAASLGQGFTLSERVRARFVTHVAAGLDEFRVIETFSKKSDRRGVLAKALTVDVFAGTKEWETRDFVVEDAPHTTKAHLGVLVLRYSDTKHAQLTHASLAHLKGVFAGSKILTKFVSIPLQDSLLLLYTETALNDRVQSFLTSAPDVFTKNGPR